MKIDFSKLKDIDLKDINLKDLKNRKELLVLLGIVIFVVSIVLIGNGLFNENQKVQKELSRLQGNYEDILKKDNSIESLNSKIYEANNKILAHESAIAPILETEVIDMLEEIQKATGVYWEKKNRTLYEAEEVDDVEGIVKFKVNISSFSTSYEQFKTLINYIKNLDRKVSVDSLELTKDTQTGKYKGKMVLNFYMLETEE